MPTLDQLDMKDFEKVMDINARGVALGCKYAAESMKKNKVEEWKSIINTSSVGGLKESGASPSFIAREFGSEAKIVLFFTTSFSRTQRKRRLLLLRLQMGSPRHVQIRSRPRRTLENPRKLHPPGRHQIGHDLRRRLAR